MRALILARLYADPLDRGKLRALAGMGAELTVLVPDVSSARHRSRFESEGSIRIVPIPARGDPADPEDLSWSARAIRRAIRDVRPELIQVEEEPWTLSARQAAREARRAQLPLIAFSREPWPDRLASGSARRRRRVLEAASGVAATSQLAASALRLPTPAPVVTIVAQNGVDVPPAQVEREDASTINIGFVGRLVAARGVDVLLRAATQLGAGWRLLVSGTGPEQIALEALAERLGIAGQVQWLGAEPRARRVALLRQLDLLVSAPRVDESWQELMATPVMLAMAHGIAVVVSRQGVLPERVGEAGVLVPPDDVDALAAALESLRGDPARRRQVGLDGRRRAQEEFSHHAVATRTLALWQQVLGSV